MTTWLVLSGMRPSTEVSSVPLGMWTAPGRAPCSYSSGSRTSRTTVGPAAISAAAAEGSTSRMDDLALASISLNVGTAITILLHRRGTPFGGPTHLTAPVGPAPTEPSALL